MLINKYKYLCTFLPIVMVNITVCKQIEMDLVKLGEDASAIALGGSLVALVVYYLIKNDLQKYLNGRNKIDVPADHASLLQLRLQAHERMIVFVERINPANLILRLYQKDIELSTLQAMSVNEIKTEFQHNITQQLYLEAATWNVVRKLKDDTIAMINNAVKNLPESASAMELSKTVLHHMSEISENPYELTIGLIKQDVRKMF